MPPSGRLGARRTATGGFTLLELLLIVAIAGLALLGGLRLAAPAGEMGAALRLKSVILWARSEAIWRGAPVSVSAGPGGTGFEVRRINAGEAAACGAGELLTTLGLSDFPGVRVASGFPSGGLIWLPSGGGRACSGGGVISATVVLRGYLGSAEVVVSSLGRVRVSRGG